VNLFEGTIIAGFNTLAFMTPDCTQAHSHRQTSRTSRGRHSGVGRATRETEPRSRAPAGFALTATVASIAYQGGRSIVHMTPPAGRPLRAVLPSEAAAAFARGDAVWASWAPADAVVLTR